MKRTTKDSISKPDFLVILALLTIMACASLTTAVITGMYHINTLNTLNERIEDLESKNVMLVEAARLSEKFSFILMEKAKKKSVFRVKVTGYHPDSGGINSDSDSKMTATMTSPKAGRTCAISTELVKAGWLGKEIYVEGFGMVVANDRLAKGIKGKQIDLCKGSYSEAMTVGVNENVLATIVSRKKIKLMMED
jgi:3D (Asp-Asp-Asp) domain-containing protein